ncbi:hypothetical protein GCM10007978_20340 [Shewanella hanedai]|nr:hypothetical protein GCM10007978_20340 [Shewanella hanedai]
MIDIKLRFSGIHNFSPSFKLIAHKSTVNPSHIKHSIHSKNELVEEYYSIIVIEHNQVEWVYQG